METSGTGGDDITLLSAPAPYLHAGRESYNKFSSTHAGFLPGPRSASHTPAHQNIYIGLFPLERLDLGFLPRTQRQSCLHIARKSIDLGFLAFSG